jgi:hypothetical protein
MGQIWYCHRNINLERASRFGVFFRLNRKVLQRNVCYCYVRADLRGFHPFRAESVRSKVTCLVSP